MTQSRARSGLAATLCLAVPLALAACSSGPPVQTNFAPLDYSYLPPITLKVASVQVRDDYLPGPNAAQLIFDAPEAPATALKQMALQRLVADGSPGSAIFVIKRASLRQVGDQLDGTMAVELDISTSNGQRVGYADATVSRSETAPSNETPDRIRAALHDLTKNLMTDMNVELQYQIQKNLPEWLAYHPGAATMTGPASMQPAPYSNGSGIQSQPLTGPGQSLVAPQPPGAPVQ